MTLQCSAVVTVSGLILDIIGVVLTLIPLVSLKRSEIQERAQRSSASYYGSNSALRDRLLVQMFLERRLVRFGLALLVLGFVLQAVGAFIAGGVSAE